MKTITLRRVDNKRIRLGELIFRDRKAGKFISLVPLIEKQHPTVEVCVLPDEFGIAYTRALENQEKNFGAKHLAGIWEKWKEKDFKNWYAMEELENEWRKGMDRPMESELLEIFPEAKSYLESKLERWSRYLLTMEKRVLSQLDWAEKQKDNFSSWFWQAIVLIQDGALLQLVEKEVWRLKLLLKIIKPRKNRITDRMIENAKRYSLPILLRVPERKSAMICCPYHSEKKPSFYVTQNGNGEWRGYCFGCGKSMDSIQFLMDQGISFRQAVLELQ